VQLITKNYGKLAGVLVAVLENEITMTFQNQNLLQPATSLSHKRKLGIKESFGTALPPLVSMNDFDTEPPANMNDSDISQETKTVPVSHNLTIFTQTSLQIIMLQSLRIRLQIASIVTNFQAELSYNEVLRLHSEITSAYRKEQSLKIISDNQSLTLFQRNYLDFILRRPLISLHEPWAAKARTNPRYYFSRKVCIDACHAIASFSPSAYYLRLLTIGKGIWLQIDSLPSSIIALKLIMQFEEETLNPPTVVEAARAKVTREPLIQALRDAASLKVERLKAGEMSVKGHLFSSMMLGQIEATERGGDIERGIAEAAMRSLRESHAILKDRPSPTPNMDAQIETPSGWENQNYGDIVDGFDFESLLDADLDFDMIDSGPQEDWDSHLWL
jgi:hypothetical protein